MLRGNEGRTFSFLGTAPHSVNRGHCGRNGPGADTVCSLFYARAGGQCLVRDPTTVGTSLLPQVTEHCLLLEDTASVFADVPLPSRWEGDRCFPVEPRSGHMASLATIIGAEMLVSVPRRTLKPHAAPLLGRQTPDQRGATSPAWVQSEGPVCSRLEATCDHSVTSSILTNHCVPHTDRRGQQYAEPSGNKASPFRSASQK